MGACAIYSFVGGAARPSARVNRNSAGSLDDIKGHRNRWPVFLLAHNWRVLGIVWLVLTNNVCVCGVGVCDWACLRWGVITHCAAPAQQYTLHCLHRLQLSCQCHQPHCAVTFCCSDSQRDVCQSLLSVPREKRRLGVDADTCDDHLQHEKRATIRRLHELCYRVSTPYPAHCSISLSRPSSRCHSHNSKCKHASVAIMAHQWHADVWSRDNKTLKHKAFILTHSSVKCSSRVDVYEWNPWLPGTWTSCAMPVVRHSVDTLCHSHCVWPVDTRAIVLLR